MRLLFKNAAPSGSSYVFRVFLRGNIYLGLLLVSSILLTQCLSATRTKPAGPGGKSRDVSVTDLPPEEYAVYNAVIEAKYREHPHSGAELVVIRNRTVAYRDEPKTLDETLKWGSKLTPGGIPPELIENLEKQNQQDHDISDLFNSSVKHVLIAEDEIAKIMKEGEWELFYQKYPKAQGLISLSRVGFDAAKTKALVYFGNPTSATSGKGGYLLLEKKAGAWAIKRDIWMWVR